MRKSEHLEKSVHTMIGGIACLDLYRAEGRGIDNGHG